MVLLTVLSGFCGVFRGVMMLLTALSACVLAIDFLLRNLRLHRCDRTLFRGVSGLAVLEMIMGEMAGA